MKITIQGQDYTTALDAIRVLTIERKLNEPSTCQLSLSLPSNGTLPVPTRNQYLTVTGDDGTPYFTGYIAATPMPEYAGLGMEGPRHRLAIQALSDEAILDQLLMPASTGSTSQTVAASLTALVTHTGSPLLSLQGLSSNLVVSNAPSQPGAPWSQTAALVANQARAAYRAVNGALSLSSVPGTVHTLNESDGSLTLASLGFSASVKRALANDVTVCGEHEPVAYVTEYFLGDGTTMTFDLAANPFFPSASKSTVIAELFSEPQINQAVWSLLGGSSYLSLGAGGLVMDGGNGTDGDVFLSWIDPIEMGGTLLLEATGVSLFPGSTGVLAGFYTALGTQAGCMAGLQATAQAGTGAVTLQPLVLGVPSGTTFALNPANQYALRVRVHCVENQRAQSIYRSFGDNGAIAVGGQSNLASGKVQMEIQEFVDGVAGVPITLYDGSIASLPASCAVVAASSINLIGSMRALNLTNLGSGWVVSTPASGGPYTRRVGTTAEAAECHVERTGKLVFHTNSAPLVGEQVAVSYRSVGRAVGRAVNAASQAALALAGLPSVAVWIGSVTNPAGRSSADCRNAAQAIEQAASGGSALWSGSYKATRFSFSSDLWPGDALLLNAPSVGIDAQVVVRSVKVSYSASSPDLVAYAIEFANDWADDLAIKTSTTVPVDSWLPAAVAPTALVNLSALTVTALSGGNVTVNAGVAAPSGGGFEIRRRDFAFMPGQDTSLVMRSTVPLMTFARENANDRFYIRMYDGATPPNYSEFSVALFINLPLSY